MPTYQMLLYEKGKTQLEPIVVRALNDLGFGAIAGEIIEARIMRLTAELL